MDRLHARTERAAYLRQAGDLLRACLDTGTVIITEQGNIVFRYVSHQARWNQLHELADAVVCRYFGTRRG